MFGIGIIGCGKIAQVRHIPEYLENPNAEIRGYFDLNLQRAQELAEKFGGKAFASVEELLADPSIDAVSVCVANFAHAEMTIKALEAGKHVLCEKPMAVTLAECEAMVAAAKKAGKHLMIGHNQRLAKAHMVAKKMIEEGTATLSSLRHDDTARKSILADLVASMAGQNVEYAVIDGFDIPMEKVRIISVPFETKSIVLASDGYPFLKPTLAESEQALQTQLRSDPLNIGRYKATKGCMEGSNSFDDRAYIRFEP